MLPPSTPGSNSNSQERSRRFSTRADRPGDRVRGQLRILMLPDADDDPAGSCERHVVTSVAGAVGGDFRDPVTAVRGRERAMVRTAMPVAAVDEDCYATPGEDDVGPDAHVAEVETQVATEAKPAGVQGRAQPLLWRRIAAMVCTHRPPRRLVTGPGTAPAVAQRT